MLKVKSVLVTNHRDGHKCEVTFQVGDETYNTIPVKLDAAATRYVVELAVLKAMNGLAVHPSSVAIAGEEPLRDKEPLPAPPSAGDVDKSAHTKGEN
jgi:hypothetical protein